MSVPVAVPSEPPASLRFRRPLDLRLFVRQLWRSKGVARALVERDLRARYKQAVLGVLWAFSAPLGYVVVFTLFFDRTADIETFGRPYPLFSYAALIPWGFFAASLTGGAQSVIGNMILLNKVACPRETFVLAAIGTALIDSLIAAVAFPIVVIVLGESFYAATLWLIPVLVVQLCFAVGIALFVGAILIYVRDVRHLLPLLTQLLMFATPVVWGMQALQDNLSRTTVFFYSLVNPMAPVCEAYRRTLVYGLAPDWPMLGAAAVSALAILGVGYTVFKKLEPGFADVA